VVSRIVTPRLELQVGTRLPVDVRSLVALADGVEGDYTDEYLLNFWSINKILAESAHHQRSGHPRDARDTPIADFLIHSWYVYLRRLGEERVGVWVEGAGIEFPSLESFFERYESDPGSLGLIKDARYTVGGTMDVLAGLGTGRP
jgi:hypothetical protein